MEARNKATSRHSNRDAALALGTKPVEVAKHIVQNFRAYRDTHSATSVDIKMVSPADFLSAPFSTQSCTALCMVAQTNNAPTEDDLRGLAADMGHDAPLQGVLPGGNMRGTGAKLANAVFFDVAFIATKSSTAAGIVEYQLIVLCGDTLAAFYNKYNENLECHHHIKSENMPLLTFPGSADGAIICKPKTGDDWHVCYLTEYLVQTGLASPDDSPDAACQRLAAGMFKPLHGADNGIVYFAPDVLRLMLTSDGTDICDKTDETDTLSKAIPNMLLACMVPNAPPIRITVQGKELDMASGYVARAVATPGVKHRIYNGQNALACARGAVDVHILALPSWEDNMPATASGSRAGGILHIHGESSLNGTKLYVGAIQADIATALATRETYNSWIHKAPYLAQLDAAGPEADPLRELHTTLCLPDARGGIGSKAVRWVFAAENVLTVINCPPYPPNVPKSDLQSKADKEELANAVLIPTWLAALESLPAHLRTQLERIKADKAAVDKAAADAAAHKAAEKAAKAADKAAKGKAKAPVESPWHLGGKPVAPVAAGGAAAAALNSKRTKKAPERYEPVLPDRKRAKSNQIK